MNKITLSYVITTYNKLPYLKEAMKRLLENVQEDEEIIVTDGASIDGTVEYLTELYQEGKIHQFISEPDKGEAHGFNKGMLMARGDLIKLISDDDAFYYPGIQECKRFMLINPKIDVLSCQGAGFIDYIPKEFEIYIDFYENWKSRAKPFAFCGLGLMIRRNSLAITGLFNPGFVRVDAEFSYRVTSSSVNLAWFTGLCWVHIGNSQSNSATQVQRMNVEMERLEQFYLGKKSINYININHLLGIVKNNLRTYVKKHPKLDCLKKYIWHSLKSQALDSKAENSFDICEHWLSEQNTKRKSEFLYRG